MGRWERADAGMRQSGMGQEKFIVFSALCFCFSCCLLLL